MPINISRLLNRPIIYTEQDDRIGSNINGPSLIKVPDWVSNPLGCYYLYFADHKGKYIRMAYADKIEGPWRIYTPGVLDLEHSLFETEDLSSSVGCQNDKYLYAHIASPDVHVDHDNQIIRMYYHGLLADADQQTRVAHSQDGLLFTARPTLLGSPYFRVFEYDNLIYAVCWAGEVLRSCSWDGPFESGFLLPGITSKERPQRILRHCALLVRKQTLHLFFSCIDDCPEHILYAQIDLDQHWASWKVNTIESVIAPKLDWEGVGLPILKSVEGAAIAPCHELRDPCIFVDNEVIYLLYCGAGECGGIGVAIVDI